MKERPSAHIFTCGRFWSAFAAAPRHGAKPIQLDVESTQPPLVQKVNLANQGANAFTLACMQASPKKRKLPHHAEKVLTAHLAAYLSTSDSGAAPQPASRLRPLI
eukprot:scaffold149616_cov22-Tisochrysis_lutea.AAC.1